ncbi:hypothetical protein FGG08_002769 [Glutinoglossum americanum]|uniref:Uncharacterized protein n=1 Tax=Glutinoglossum americanum TaxID=1670608 RepID=A0A9P8I5Q9_9PEZI|nr:hypothetical protein FGG08_002769 [Glutinoglossum americanum]
MNVIPLASTSRLKSLGPPSWSETYSCWGDSQVEGYSTPFQDDAVRLGEDSMEDRDSQGRTRLRQVALDGSREQVQQLFAEGADINASGRRGSQPLHYAASGAFTEVAGHLVGSGASIGATDGSGWTHPHSAAATELKGCGNLRDMEKLLKTRPEPSTTDLRGNTPLHLALAHADSADWTQLPSVKRLLDQGADVNLHNAAGVTPFQMALEHLGSQIPPALITMFLQHGANVNLRNTAGVTPFQVALEHLGSRIPPALITMFLQHGANVGLKDRKGILPFQLYLEKLRPFRYCHPFLKDETNAVARAFLVYGATPNITSRPEESLLCYLLRDGDYLRYNPELVLLICEKANPNFRGRGGDYPLHEVIACSIKHGLNCVGVLQLLLDRGADPNAVNDAKVSPLLALLSTRGKRLETLRMTKALLEKGADPMLRDSYGRLAVYEVVKLYEGEVRRDIVKLLLSASSNPCELLNRDSPPIGPEDIWWQLFDVALQSSRAGYPCIGLIALRNKGWLLPATTDQAVIHAVALTVTAEAGLDHFTSEEWNGSQGASSTPCAPAIHAGDFTGDFASLLRVCQQQGIEVDRHYHYQLDRFE